MYFNNKSLFKIVSKSSVSQLINELTHCCSSTANSSNTKDIWSFTKRKDAELRNQKKEIVYVDNWLENEGNIM